MIGNTSATAWEAIKLGPGWGVKVVDANGTWFVGPFGEDVAKAFEKLGTVASKIVEFPVAEEGMSFGFLGMSRNEWKEMVQNCEEAIKLINTESKGKL